MSDNLVEEIMKEAREGMENSLSALVKSYQTIRTGRASPHLLDRIKIEVYGSLTPIQQLGNISVPEPRILSVQVYDSNNVKAVEKAIRESSLGLNPSIHGNLIRITLPELTEERREELVKHTSKLTEEARISIRSVRRDAIEKVKKGEKEHTITEDDRESTKGDIQKLTDQFNQRIDNMFEAKKKDILSV